MRLNLNNINKKIDIKVKLHEILFFFHRSAAVYKLSVRFCSLFTHRASYFLLQRGVNHRRFVYIPVRGIHIYIIYVYKATCEQWTDSQQSLSRVSQQQWHNDGHTGYLCAIFVVCAREREHRMAFSTSRRTSSTPCSKINRSLATLVLCPTIRVRV